MVCYWILINNGLLINFGKSTGGAWITLPLTYTQDYIIMGCYGTDSTGQYKCYAMGYGENLAYIRVYLVATYNGSLDYSGNLFYLTIGY